MTSTTTEKYLEVTLSQVFQLRGLKKSFLVVYYPQWAKKKFLDQMTLVERNVITPIVQRFGFRPRTVVLFIQGSDSPEEYIIEKLNITKIPHVEIYSRGNRVNGWHVEEIPDSFYWLCQFEPESTDLFPGNVQSVLFQSNQYTASEPLKIFVSGERSSVGKSTICLAILAALIERGIPPEDLAYIKPVTQCEAEQPITQYCRSKGISNVSIGPVVFYQGFTRSFLNNETETPAALLEKVRIAVDDVSRGKKFVLVDGVGYPSVGSICNISNGHVAQTLGIPVLLVGKSGVGDAVDSYNLNRIFFESFGVRVLGGIFNKFELDGFYALPLCRDSINSYFKQYQSSQLPYGFLPKLSFHLSNGDEINLDAVKNLVNNFEIYVQVERLLYDIWQANLDAKSFLVSGVPVETWSAAKYSHGGNYVPMEVYVPPASSSSGSLTGGDGGRAKKRGREEIEEEAKSKGAKGG